MRPTTLRLDSDVLRPGLLAASFLLASSVGCGDTESMDTGTATATATNTFGSTSDSGSSTSDDAGDGDATTAGDGDGDGGTGDGDGTSTGDGDTSGDGDTAGDGDGTGDGDGDGTTTGDGTTGDGDGTTTTGDGDGDGDGDGCFEMMVTLTPIEPYVLLVIDKSGSMLSNTFEDATMTQVTRWQGLYDVVDNVATNFGDSLQLGALLYPGVNVDPTSGTMACIIDSTAASFVGAGSGNGTAIINLLPPRDAVSGDFGGATPTHDALQVGYQHLMGLPDPSIPRAVILVTDGAANCNTVDNSGVFDILQTYDNRLSGLVSNGFSTNNIPTYVVGIGIDPGVPTCSGMSLPTCGAPWHEQGTNPTMSEIIPYDKLDALAVDGGAPAAGPPSFFSALNQTELEMQLQGIAAGLLSCIINLGAVPPFPDSVTVDTGTSAPWGLVGDCATDDGFVYVDADTVELCNAACDELVMAGSAEVVFSCMAG